MRIMIGEAVAILYHSVPNTFAPHVNL